MSVGPEPVPVAGGDTLRASLARSELSAARHARRLSPARALPLLRSLSADADPAVRSRAAAALARLPPSADRDQSLLAIHASFPSEATTLGLGAATTPDVIPAIVAALPGAAACTAFAARASAHRRLPLPAWQALLAAATTDAAPPPCVFAATATPAPLDAPRGAYAPLARWATVLVDQPPTPQSLALIRGAPALHSLLPPPTLAALAAHPDGRLHRVAQRSLLALDSAEADRALVGLLAPEFPPPARQTAYRNLRTRAHLSRVYERLRSLEPLPPDRCLMAELLDTARAWPNLVGERCTDREAGLSEVRVLLAGTGSVSLRQSRLRSIRDGTDDRFVRGAARRALERLAGPPSDACVSGSVEEVARTLAAALVSNDFPRTWKCAHRLATVAPEHAGLQALARHPVAALRALTRTPASPAPWPNAPDPVAVRLIFETSRGRVVVELDAEAAPIASVQIAEHHESIIGPGYPTPRGLVLGTTEPAVPALPDEGIGRPIERGALVLLHRGAPDTASFTFLVANQALPEWRYDHTVVGQVVSGLAAIDLWSSDDLVISVSRETFP